MILKYNDDKCIATKIYNANNEIETIYGNISQTQYGLLSSLNSYDASGKFIMSFANEYDRIYQVGSTARDSLGKLTSEVKINLTAKKYPEKILEVTYLKDSKTRKLFSYK